MVRVAIRDKEGKRHLFQIDTVTHMEAMEIARAAFEGAVVILASVPKAVAQ